MQDKSLYQTAYSGEYTVPSGISYVIFCASLAATDAKVYNIGDGTIFDLNNKIEASTQKSDKDFSAIYRNFLELKSVELAVTDLYGSHDVYNANGECVYISGIRYISNIIPVNEGDRFSYQALNNTSTIPSIVTFSSENVVDISKSLFVDGTETGIFTVPSGVVCILVQAIGLTKFHYIDSYTITDNKDFNNIVKELWINSIDNTTNITGAVIYKNYYNEQRSDYNNGIIFHTNEDDLNFTTRSNEPINVFNSLFTVGNNFAAIIDWDKISSFSIQFTISNINLRKVRDIIYSPGLKLSSVENSISENANNIHILDSQVNGRHIEYSNDDLSTGVVTYYMADGSLNTNAYRRITGLISVEEGDIFNYAAQNTDTVLTIAAFNSNKELILNDSTTTVYGTYTVPSGIRYIQYQAQNNNGNHITLTNQENGLVDKIEAVEDLVSESLHKILPTKVIGFSTFNSNTAWTINTDKTVAYTTSAGVAYRLVDRVKFYSDCFNLCARIIPSGTTFECLVGKWAGLSGTMFGILYDGEDSYLTTYIVTSSSEITQANKIAISNVSLENNKPVCIRISKKTLTSSFYDIDVFDDKGNIDVLHNIGLSNAGGDTSNENNGSTTGYAWGQLCLYMLSGTRMEVSNFSLGFPISDELDVICLGDSYVEGNSIPLNKDKRFISIICEKIGTDKTLILGQGGQTAAVLSSIITDYTKWFPNAKYAILNIGGNDVNYNPTSENITNCIANCESIKTTLENANIIPVWIVNSGWFDNYQSGIDEISVFNDWLLSQPYHVDARFCFRNGNSNDSAAYLSDGVHPTVATHAKIANCIIAQAGYLFN